MGTTRALTLGIIAVGLVSMGSTLAPAGAAKFVNRSPAIVQLFSTNASIVSASIGEIQGSTASYNVEVNNPTASDLELTLHFKTQAIPVKAKAKAKTAVGVQETAKELTYDCQLVGRKVSFNLTGNGADTRTATFEWTGTPVWTSSAAAGSLGASPIPDGPKEVWASGPATLEVPFECGKKPKIKFKVDNQTAKTLQGLKLRMMDVDGTVLAEESVGTLGANTSKMMAIAATSPPKGIERYNSGDSLEVRIIDSQHELNANQITTAGFIRYDWTSGPVSLKVSN